MLFFVSVHLVFYFESINPGVYFLIVSIITVDTSMLLDLYLSSIFNGFDSAISPIPNIIAPNIEENTMVVILFSFALASNWIMFTSLRISKPSKVIVLYKINIKQRMIIKKSHYYFLSYIYYDKKHCLHFTQC